MKYREIKEVGDPVFVESFKIGTGGEAHKILCG